jgi:3-hydroxyacyl-CoA dehydrogenase
MTDLQPAGHRAVVIGSGGLAQQAAALLADAGVFVTTVTALADASPEDQRSISTADWILELSDGDLQSKRAALAALDPLRRPESVVTIDESVVPLGELLGGLVLDHPRGIAIAHLFSPLKHMRLAELVAGVDVDVERISRLLETVMGRDVVVCADRPGFIANRLGLFLIAVSIHETLASGVPIDVADGALKTVVGSAVGPFALCDLIGIGLVRNLIAQLTRRLPADDPFARYDLSSIDVIEALIERGDTGRKCGAGFYWYDDPGSVLDASDLVYYPLGVGRSSDPSLDRLAGRVAVLTGRYADYLSIQLEAPRKKIETVMRGGYGWKITPTPKLQKSTG